MAPIDRFEGSGGRGFGPGGALPDAAARHSRLRERAARLSKALQQQRPDAAPETARVLHEAAGLPNEARQGLLAALAGAVARDPAVAARERLVTAFPKGSERRQRLGEALVRLSRTAIEARVVPSRDSSFPQRTVHSSQRQLMPSEDRSAPQSIMASRKRSSVPVGSTAG